MNIVNKLTIRHLRQNKRRTMVTIIGVIISVAMVTAVATLTMSFMGLFQKQVIASEGEWHVLYEDVNQDQIAAIRNDDATKALVISRDVGYAPLVGSQNDYKPYVFITEYNEQGFQQFPIELIQGRLPQAGDEVVISEAIASNAKVEFQIGQTLKLDVGERTLINGNDGDHALYQSYSLQTTEDGELAETLTTTSTNSYTIVGFIKRPTWEPTWAPGYTMISYVDESLIGNDNKAQALVVLNKVTKSLYDHAVNLAKENNIKAESIHYNDDLLRYYGVTNDQGLNRTLYSLAAIIIAIIMVGSISLIYNSFAISVSERARHLGMLSSVGATNRQKKNSVFFEGALIGLISIPIGIIFGLVGIGITFFFINSMIQDVLGITEWLTVTVTPWSILVASTVSMLTIFISTYIPARKASKISAIDAIRQTTDIKLSSKAVRTSKLISKVFGIEAEIGLKNLKRNRRKYQATVFSLVISIVLFLAVSSFTDNLQKSFELSQDGFNFDIQVSIGNEIFDEQMADTIASLEDVTEFSRISEKQLYAWIDEADISDELHELVKQDNSLLVNGKFLYHINVIALDEISLRTYSNQLGANYETLVDSDQMKVIVVETNSFLDEGKGKFVETTVVHKKNGQGIDLHDVDFETGVETYVDKVEIVALTDQLPMGSYPTGLSTMNIVVSEQLMGQLTNKLPGQSSRLYLKSTNPLKTQQEIEEMKMNHVYIFNIYQSRQQEEQLIMIMSVFTYGFILLITAISVANIFNTTSTSISLRKREFAMLKSVGMTPMGLNKMINYESIFYGIKSLLYGLPISLAVMYLIHMSLSNSFSYAFTLPWSSIIFVIIAVFVIVISAMLYASSKVKKENIIDVLKQESI